MKKFAPSRCASSRPRLRAERRAAATSTRREFIAGVAAACVGAAIGCASDAASPPGPEPGPPSDPWTPPRASDVLAELLAENRTRDPEFGGGLANHQSMALVALAALGADGDRLRAFAAKYAHRLQRLRTESSPVAWTNWTDAIGRPAALTGLIAAFSVELRMRGRGAVLRECVPALVPGVGGAGFHGMIRTAYALRVDGVAGADDELAHALAYWATVAAPLRRLSPPHPETGAPAALLARALADPSLREGELPQDLISSRMRAVAERDGFDRIVGALDVDDGTLDAVAQAVLLLYVGTRNFTALHAVTATHAVRLLLPHAGDRATALRMHWQSIVAAAVTVPRAVIPPQSRSAYAPGWDAIVARAVASDDDHDVKLTDTCRKEFATRGLAAYAEAAALRLGML